MKQITVKELNDSKQWDALFRECGSHSFLQSWQWGEVQRAQGYEIRHLAIYEGNNPIGLALTLFIKAKRGNMIFVPHGPMLKGHVANTIKKQVLLELKNLLVKQALEKGYHFIRIAPVWDDTLEARNLFALLNFKPSPIYMHAERVWILDIRKGEEELLSEMRKTTRYSIRKAEKEGVVIKDDADLEKFWDIYKETAQRENFTPFSKTFIANEYGEFRKANRVLFLTGFLPDGKTCAASALIVFTPSTAFYHQGATTHSKIPVSYLLQWRAIQEAKKRGCSYYNFWGILQPGRTPKNWGGLSLFKQGFGGFQKDYVPTHDYVVNPIRYGINFLIETVLKWKRGV